MDQVCGFLIILFVYFFCLLPFFCLFFQQVGRQVGCFCLWFFFVIKVSIIIFRQAIKLSFSYTSSNETVTQVRIQHYKNYMISDLFKDTANRLKQRLIFLFVYILFFIEIFMSVYLFVCVFSVERQIIQRVIDKRGAKYRFQYLKQIIKLRFYLFIFNQIIFIYLFSQ
ncbi:transmembrane protein, putative (macronuclear) [Tetrahymena thermophila SB210]|uniref:Transmembrane protein, putative n=1 Tax=Tetrahymena thermophila (strain SB210) TaxID=312017 RepID=A4VEE3_TETTS|nr:transmembrane protein, putative [Tetrahymena thermophila SB210]EDK31895.1 transmembrane protein, putative [Tetrahymena thermophila SB210]|eukprot:XP_001470619.1 transmembrane protein, putative [Tetrahymena thermophila SB210]